MQYEIFCSTQWLENKLMGLEFEKKKKTEVIKEVSGLRKNISDLKVNISTITKGMPIMAIEDDYIGTNNCFVNIHLFWKVSDPRTDQISSRTIEDEEKTLSDVVTQMPQPSMEKMLNLQADQISDASAILGVVKIKHNY